MADSSAETLLAMASRLLTYYSYEVDGHAQDLLLERWLHDYSPEWVRLALIESLYRGRYKTISVRGLLADWQRKGHPTCNFNREFEALICHNFPQIWFKQDIGVQDIPASPATIRQDWERQLPKTQPPPSLQKNAVDLNSVVSSAQASQPWTANRSNADASLMGEKLWEGIENTEVHQKMSALLGQNTPDQTSSSASVKKVTSPKLDVSPIGQFTPKSEFSELYQKLVSMVSSA
ncbi:hypothetical protein [Acaryochloris sp. IP29b_bin.137]|uniref:hypothetical protein n=1 Tax=Acaryochloris sp. IP29b_bin.137 TaxID=2969217 RepID=UPI0026298F66|nr:hypothetical protein [Acaryochloris sp. IP29b_bin.137]